MKNASFETALHGEDRCAARDPSPRMAEGLKLTVATPAVGFIHQD